MSITTKKRQGKEYEYFQAGQGKTYYLAPVGQPERSNISNVLKAIDYLRNKYEHYSELEHELVLRLPENQRNDYLLERFAEIDARTDALIPSLSEAEREKYLEKRTAELQAWLRRPQIQTEEPLESERLISVASVYGLNSQAYSVASSLTLMQFKVFLIDESLGNAISLKADMARTYPDVRSIVEDEPLLGLKDLDSAILRSKYIFFIPRLRKIGEDVESDLNAELKDVVKAMKKGSVFIFGIPTGIGGNNEKIKLIERITNFEVGNDFSYYYYPMGPAILKSSYIGSHTGEVDSRIMKALQVVNPEINIGSLRNTEISYAMKALHLFPLIHDILSQRKFADKVGTSPKFLPKHEEIFIEEILDTLFALRMLVSSREKPNLPVKELVELGFNPEYCNVGTLTMLARDCINLSRNYLQDLTKKVKMAIEENKLDYRKLQLGLGWTTDPFDIGAERSEALLGIQTQLTDYLGRKLEFIRKPSIESIDASRPIVFLAGSKTDLKNAIKLQTELKTNNPDLQMVIVR